MCKNKKYFLVHEIQAENIDEALKVQSELESNTGLQLRLILDEDEFNCVRSMAGKVVNTEGEEVGHE